ncbi:3-oxoacyl-[acyl-carrier-protein] synthase II, chloroplastic-like [Salvia splendens]|uniref:3-oxoacyl-[acyl-carrier-protein] synthase II, chloroplastic-like n=1 Tax=Salvia splendens TaxID=180675 RepID=UPI001C26C6AE|nr:3-oxoacyl-[acyl-carrier-protein] synthase II, chloroplastic-like [Salvia splendens]
MGLGVVSPLGHNVDEFYGNLLQGISGVTHIESFDTTQFPTGWMGPTYLKGSVAGVLLLEELEHAKQRGAPIYAEFLGGSFAFDPYYTMDPQAHSRSKSCFRCIETALAESRVDREDINYINAHAASIPAFDLAEYQSITHLFAQNSESPIRGCWGCRSYSNYQDYRDRMDPSKYQP